MKLKLSGKAELTHRDRAKIKAHERAEKLIEKHQQQLEQQIEQGGITVKHLNHKTLKGGAQIARTPSAPANLTTREREETAYTLRIAGWGYKEIGPYIGVSSTAAYQMVMRVLDRMETDLKGGADKVRNMELDRLDEMIKVLWPKVKAGDQFAVDRVLKIQERRAKFAGLDAPVKLDQNINAQVEMQTYTDDKLEAEIRALMVLTGAVPKLADGVQPQGQLEGDVVEVIVETEA